MSDILLAIVGCGQWGLNHVRTFASLHTCRIGWVVDSDHQRREQARQWAGGARMAEDMEIVLDDQQVAACVIATNSSTHYRLAKRALQAGRHVLVEKPLALSASEAEDLVELAERSGLVLMVGHLLLYHPAVNRLKDIIAQGVLGQIHYLYSVRANWGADRQNESLLWTLGPHDISLILHLLGQKPVRTMARGRKLPGRDNEEVIFATLDFPSGQMAQVHLSWLDHQKIRRFTVVGARRMAVFDDMEVVEKLRLYEGVPCEDGYASYHDLLDRRQSKGEVIPLEMAEPLKLEAEHFLECIRQKEKPLSDGLNGLWVVRILEAIAASLKSGRPQVIRSSSTGQLDN